MLHTPLELIVALSISYFLNFVMHSSRHHGTETQTDDLCFCFGKLNLLKLGSNPNLETPIVGGVSNCVSVETPIVRVWFVDM
jgi:hypothetical protein